MPNDNQIKDIIGPKRADIKVPLGIPKKSSPPRAHSKKPILLALLVLAVIFGIAFGAKIADLKTKTVSSGKTIYERAREGASALANLDTEKARGAFSFINEEIDKLKTELDKIGFSKIISLGKIFTPLAEEIPGAINDFASLSTNIFSLTEKADTLAKNSFNLAFNKKGDDLLKLLRALQTDIKSIIGLSSSLKAHATALRLQLPDDYLALNVRLYRTSTLLESLLGLLEGNDNLHIAVLFQNPSEIRPAGGFIGSYADVAIKNGSIENIDVRDIYDPDGWVEEKTIPPTPLQSITNTWEARDANWFFDFPTSAEKVISFLNKSKIYSEKNVKFEAALAINVHLIEDILGLLGPITLDEYSITINKDNFLETVQKEVESGEDKRNGEPKKILKVLTPKIFERLANLSAPEKRSLAKIFAERIKTKDVLAYARDRVLEGYLQNEGLGGDIFSPEGGGANDYLAIVHANIAGGKTDALINENVVLESALDFRGIISNKLTIEREHTGGGKTEWWYNSPNKDYFQILTLAGTRLLGATGHDKKIPNEPIKRPKYLKDPDVEAIEKTTEWLPEFKISRFRQFGKNTFGNWLTVKAGEKKKLILEYENPENFPVADGANYKFVFERQSGVNPIFRYVLEAPAGYIWRESGKTTFIYGTDRPESRTILDLTLQKLD